MDSKQESQMSKFHYSVHLSRYNPCSGNITNIRQRYKISKWWHAICRCKQNTETVTGIVRH